MHGILAKEFYFFFLKEEARGRGRGVVGLQKTFFGYIDFPETCFSVVQCCDLGPYLYTAIERNFMVFDLLVFL